MVIVTVIASPSVTVACAAAIVATGMRLFLHPGECYPRLSDFRPDCAAFLSDLVNGDDRDQVALSSVVSNRLSAGLAGGDGDGAPSAITQDQGVQGATLRHSSCTV